MSSRMIEDLIEVTAIFLEIEDDAADQDRSYGEVASERADEVEEANARIRKMGESLANINQLRKIYYSVSAELGGRLDPDKKHYVSTVASVISENWQGVHGWLN